MSLQDDYFDLMATLKGRDRKAFLRIWDAFVEMENEHEDLCSVRRYLRDAVELAFKPYRQLKPAKRPVGKRRKGQKSLK